MTATAYVVALSQIRAITGRDILRIIEAFPNEEALFSAPGDCVADRLGSELSIRLMPYLKELPRLANESQCKINTHFEKGIAVVPIGDPNYPTLLKLVLDPPPVLYIKGDLSAVTRTDSVAIIGTRQATMSGCNVARQIARNLAQSGYVIVSGLAKGIDTAAHVGALDSEGRTVAVLGNAIDKIYPAENKPLVERILACRGAVLSELAIGEASFRASFVKRDRIQSGLSLAVIPVQTDTDGGTMHTIKFAEQQNRLIFCPRPLDAEMRLKQNAGIMMLIRTGKAREFRHDEINKLMQALQIHKDVLLSPSTPGSGQVELSKRRPNPLNTGKMQMSLPSFGMASAPYIDRIQEYFSELGLDKNRDEFETVFRSLRARFFENRMDFRTRADAHQDTEGAKDTQNSTE